MQIASSKSTTTILHKYFKVLCGKHERQRNPYYHINDALMCLEKQERLMIHNTSMKYQIMSLKLGLKFLEVFLKYSTDSTLQMHIEDVLYYVNLELHSLNSLWSRLRRKTLILNLERVYANLQKKLKSIIEEPESKHYFVIGPECTCLLFVDSLLDAFCSLENSNTNLLAPLIKQFADLRESLMFLESFFVSMEFLSNDKYTQVEILLNYLLIYVVAVVDRAACVVYSSLVGKTDDEMVQRVNARFSALNVNPDLEGALRSSTSLLSRERFSELELDPTNGLLVLLDSLAGSAVSMDSPARKVFDELKAFSNFLTGLPSPLKKEKLNYLIMSVVSVTSKALIIMNSRYREKVQAMNNEVNGLLFDLVDEIRYVKMRARAREFKPHNTSIIDGLGFFDNFLGKLNELPRYCTEDIKPIESQVISLHEEFDKFRHFMSQIEELLIANEELQDPWRHIVSLAYQAEYDIDSFLVKSVGDMYIISSIPTIIKKVGLVKSELQAQHDTLTLVNESCNVVGTSQVSSNDKLVTDVVGFEGQAREILDDLLGIDKPLSIVSIIGMPGLGKTTMAKKLYNDPYVCEHFYVRAWCCVSQTYQKRQLLLDILDGLIKFDDEIYEKSDEELAELIYKLLRGQRYLIVVDDLWDIQAWDLLNRSLPDDDNCSRIIITSRLENVASLSNKVHNLRPLSAADSWELLQLKLFGKERCPSELSDVGQQIAISCKGLPLGVTVTSGLLAIMDEELDQWELVARRLNSLILSDPSSQVMKILELSFKHLPGHLKSCFLYVGVFPEDQEIPVQQLKWLWIAEGFVQNLDSRSQDDLAEDYLMELIGRSLIIPSKERSQGGVKTCHIHDLLREFCLEKAEEDKLLGLICTENFSNYSKVYEQLRLSISYRVSYDVQPNPDWCNVRSLLYTSQVPSLTRDVSFITNNSLLLRVLDLGYVMCESIEGIDSLIHLRYLAVQARTTSIPSSISNLWNLQTFLFTAEIGSEDVSVPASIWDMVKLKHMHIDYGASFCFPNGSQMSSFKHTLETLSTPSLCFGEDAENLVRCLPNLKKLRCIYLDSFDDSENCNRFPVLRDLDQLMSLKVCYKGSLLGCKCEFNFPLNLRKLTLSNFWVPWDEISSIGKKLPKLEVLKLTNDAASGETWNMEEGDFPKLKYLELNIVVLIKWNATEDSVPCLERLVVKRCTTLAEIPESFADIPTLRMIMVQRCKPSVDESARNILRAQIDEMGNEELKVYIYPKSQE